MNLMDLASFVRVVELGTITAAASEEGVPKSTISRRIARLEQSLGIELLRRSPRSFVLTDDGKTLHARSRGALLELEYVEQDLVDGADEPQGRLVVSAPPDLGLTGIFVDLISSFQQRYTQVQIEIRLDTRIVALLEEGVDVAFRMYTGSIPGGDNLMSRTLRTESMGFYAAPAYLKAHGVPTSLPDLAHQKMVLHPNHSSREIALQSIEQSVDYTMPESHVKTDDFSLIRALLESGSGVGILPRMIAEESISNGKLIPILSNWSAQTAKLSLVWPTSRHLSPRIRTFVNTTVERLTEKSV